jgi:signal transduction histidine kinase
VPQRRFPGPQEAAAYFVCSEGLANVAKYAQASSARIAVAALGPRLVVRVADDGVGGANPARGSGLRGLVDRVEALGGTLSVTSPLGAGTRLKAELPIGAESSG